jgi:antitoxin component YwqK of YwqJK toxin-antitoxin module
MRGELKQWFSNGKLERRGEYRNGLRQNRYEIWYEDGTPEALLNYDAGSLIQAQCWNAMGKPRNAKHCLSDYQNEE